MARLIDADAIQYTHAIARSIEDGHNWNELCVTKEDIDAAPTVPAIPVEWMVSWINRHPNDLRCVWFASLEMEWQKEQEAE